MSKKTSVTNSSGSRGNKRLKNIEPLVLKGKTKYIPLTENDKLYKENLFKLSNN